MFDERGYILGNVTTTCPLANGSKSFGVPGVKVLMEDGTYAITDAQGRYSFYGVRAQTHVLKLDAYSLPRGTQLLATSNRSMSDGGTQFVDLKFSELRRADFQCACSDRIKALIEQKAPAKTTDELGTFTNSTFNADVYVFCVQTATLHSEYDPLDTGQWDFYVLPRKAIQSRGYKSIGLAALDAAGSGPISYEALAGAIAAAWEGGAGPKLAVLTGGEPLLQVDSALVSALHESGFEVAVETNGTLPKPEGIDWLCVSPKAGTEIVQRRGDELKLVWPQADIDPDTLLAWDFRHFLLQPMDGPPEALAATIGYVMHHPAWKLSLQTHKLLGLP